MAEITENSIKTTIFFSKKLENCKTKEELEKEYQEIQEILEVIFESRAKDFEKERGGLIG